MDITFYEDDLVLITVTQQGSVYYATRWEKERTAEIDRTAYGYDSKADALLQAFNWLKEALR